ncbi:MAG TPA: lipopolysaccharide kinase InaA family protein [Azonexus sp.]
MSTWWCDPALPIGAGQAFADLERVFALDGELIAKSPLSRVLRVTLEGRRYYVKHYVGDRSGLLRSWFGLRSRLLTPRVQKEWENLLAFQSWGIPTARLVAYGQERHGGRFVRGALITEELAGTADLAQMANEGDPRLKDGRWVAAVSRQLAQATRAMHAAGFAHNDLKWRNLLVDRNEPPRLYLIDCPTGGRWWGPFLDYRKIKDLACLDKVARYQLSRPQRLRFYLDYVQRPRLNAADRKVLAKVLAFFAGRE